MKSTSDKIYWHKYNEFYENLIPANAKNILEIGVFKGESIRYWRELYSEAKIYGLDIVPAMPEWPQDDRIRYFQADQSDAQKYREILLSIDQPIDLLIEDGSHDPLHQKISLLESIDFLAPGAIYILEDLHTSHPGHEYYKKRAKTFNKSVLKFFGRNGNIFMPLQCLLLIDHLKTNQIALETVRNRINYAKSLFTFDEIEVLFKKIKKITFYRRSVLPDYCYSCKTNNFDFTNLKCACGADLYAEADSMTAVIKF